MYKKMDLALNNLKWLICHITKPNKTKPGNVTGKNEKNGRTCLDQVISVTRNLAKQPGPWISPVGTIYKSVGTI